MNASVNASRRRLAPLLFLSGACSLVYETVWLRELRLVFGASTMASAAVVACFVGGLGVGGVLLGRRANVHPRPLALYAQLEATIAVSAAVTPLLLLLARTLYLSVGGTRALGLAGGTALRLVLSSFVFAVPTVCMGGTLPAVARVVGSHEDRDRRGIAILYGVNTLGAVTGCMASTFFLFEVCGTRLSLFVACLVNALVAVVARAMARELPDVPPSAPSSPPPSPRSADLAGPASEPHRAHASAFTLAAAAVSGFVFCLMELVWYRMLGPLLGGSVFTFGVILAVALAGIGMGGVLYGVRPTAYRATRSAFAWTCLLEAACVAAPYACGDRIAVLAALLRPIGGLGFASMVLGWTFLTALVVFPTALVSGFQFTLLVSLLGAGERDAARDVGRVYGANTVGSIAGSLAGGFGLIPLLSAPGCWRGVVLLLVAVGVVAASEGALRRPWSAAGKLVVATGAMLALLANGPSSAWRHSPIGAGRVDPGSLRSANDVIAWEHDRRRAITWEVDGQESSVALATADGVAFVVNGKVDGSAVSDAGTTIMAGMIGALLHRHPTRAMVIGLGTGETAGWLGAIDSITDVDVAELEPAILEVARRSTRVNHGALDNPKVHVEIGDARELLLTSTHHYSLVMSEPSNPYRAGVASLFTKSYYEAIADRLDEDGLFLQWLQGYEVDGATVRTVYATLASAFPEVETWELNNEDLLLVAAKHPIVHDAGELRARLAVEPYRSASADAWRATDLEGILGHFVATGALARSLAASQEDRVNTDDQNLVEFGFARAVGVGRGAFTIADVRRAALLHHEERPTLEHGAVDWSRADELKLAYDISESRLGVLPALRTRAEEARVAALVAVARGDSPGAVRAWRAQSSELRGHAETALLAMAFADVADPETEKYAEELAPYSAPERAAVLAHLAVRRGDAEAALGQLEALFLALRTDPWPMDRLVRAAIDDARQVATSDPARAARVYASLREPFVLHLVDAARMDAAFRAAVRVPGAACVDALAAFGANVPWNDLFLRERYRCLRAQHDPRAAQADADWQVFHGAEPRAFADE